MKKPKQRIPEKEDWHLESESVNDTKKSGKPVNPTEKALLEATIKSGGLIKERWRWSGGKPAFSGYILPKKKA